MRFLFSFLLFTHLYSLYPFIYFFKFFNFFPFPLYPFFLNNFYVNLDCGQSLWSSTE